MTGTPVGTALSAPPKPIEIISALLPPAVKWKAFFKQPGQEPEVPAARRRRRGHRGHRRRRDRPGHPAHRGEVRVTPDGRSRRHRRRRTDRRHRRHAAWRSTASTAWSWIAGTTSIRSRAPSISTTRSTASSRVSASPTSSPRSPGPRSGLRLLDPTMRVLAEFRRDTARKRARLPAGQHVRPARASKRCCAHNLKPLPERASCAATSRSPTSPSTSHGRSGSPSPIASTGASTSSTPTTCSAATAPTASCALASAPPCEDLRFEQRWLVVDVATDADLDQWDGVHQVCDPDRAAHLHAHRRHPLPLGVPAAARRDRRRLRHARGAAPADRALGRRRRRRRPRAGSRRRVHVPRADRRPVAARQRVPARRRRPPHPTVHRPGHGRRTARCDEPGVEARRRARRRVFPGASWTPTSRSESRMPGT